MAISLNPNFFDKKLNIQLNVKGIYNTNRFADTGAIGMATQYDPTQLFTWMEIPMVTATLCI